MKTFYVNIKCAAVAAFTGVVFLCSGGMLHAEEGKLYYTLTAIEDVSYGEEVVAGDYDAAIEGILSSAKMVRTGFEAQTNLCVAYTRSGDFEKAGESCDAALAAIKKHLRRMDSTGLAAYQSRRVRDRYFALALSNRGVLRAISGQPGLARKDFVQATELRFGLDVADVNLAKLGAAQATRETADASFKES